VNPDSQRPDCDLARRIRQRISPDVGAPDDELLPRQIAGSSKASGKDPTDRTDRKLLRLWIPSGVVARRDRLQLVRDGLLPADGKKAPGPRYSLQFVFPALDELDV
jgi:hypothetical protein